MPPGAASRASAARRLPSAIRSSAASAMPAPAMRIERPEWVPPPKPTRSVSPDKMRTASTSSPRPAAATWAKLVSCPWPADWVPITTSTTPSARTVIRACSRGVPVRGLDVIGQTTPEQLAPSARFAAALAEAGPGGEMHHERHVLGVSSAVVDHAERVGVGHARLADQVAAAELGAVEARRGGGEIDQPLDRKGDLGTAR